MHRTGRERVKRFAERVAPVAQTTHPTQAGLARVLNSLVVPPFLRCGNWQRLRALFCAHKPHYESSAVFFGSIFNAALQATTVLQSARELTSIRACEAIPKTIVHVAITIKVV